MKRFAILFLAITIAVCSMVVCAACSTTPEPTTELTVESSAELTAEPTAAPTAEPTAVHTVALTADPTESIRSNIRAWYGVEPNRLVEIPVYKTYKESHRNPFYPRLDVDYKSINARGIYFDTAIAAVQAETPATGGFMMRDLYPDNIDDLWRIDVTRYIRNDYENSDIWPVYVTFRVETTDGEVGWITFK